MNVLVTGVAGFIGFHVTQLLLSRGDSVIGIDNLNSYYDVSLKRARLGQIGTAAGFDFRKIDLSDRFLVKELFNSVKPEKVIHLAAQAGVRYSLENPQAYIDSNIQAFLNILEGCRHNAVDHLVYASSSSVYGGNSKMPFAVSDSADHQLGLYGATKRANELMAHSYSHLYGIPTTGLRFFTVYGPWGRPDMMPWIFTSKILNGDPIPVFNHGKMQRDFTFVDDIVRGIVSCLDAPPADDGAAKPGGSIAPHAIYNIGNNRPEELMRVIGIIEEACGRKATIEMKPMQKGDVPRTFADIDALARDHGFAPETSADEGFPRFVHWFKAYHGLG